MLDVSLAVVIRCIMGNVGNGVFDLGGKSQDLSVSAA